MRLLTRRLALAAAMALSLGGLAAAQTPVTPDDMTLGNPKAKVTVVEYASTACPHCAAWNADVWPAFKAKYVDTGKINYVYREFITSPPEVAVAGPVIARCAGKGKYFSVLDGAFRAQEEIYKTNSLAPLIKVAQANGLSEEQVKTCLTNQASIDAMQTRVQGYAERDKIEATPTFIVNGKKLEGGQPLAALDAAIAAAN
jgi:protein-disulfide isomerase